MQRCYHRIALAGRTMMLHVRLIYMSARVSKHQNIKFSVYGPGGERAKTTSSSALWSHSCSSPPLKSKKVYCLCIDGIAARAPALIRWLQISTSLACHLSTQHDSSQCGHSLRTGRIRHQSTSPQAVRPQLNSLSTTRPLS